MSRNPAEPPKDGLAGARRWADYLDWLREDAIVGVLTLPSSEQGSSRLPSGWSPRELLNHLLHMEQRWFVWGFLGEQVPAPWGDWSVGDPSSAPDPEQQPAPVWRLGDEASIEAVAEALRAVGRRTATILGTHDLSERARIGGRFTQSPPTLEWICFHVLAEYARHAGHLDIVRELASDAS